NTDSLAARTDAPSVVMSSRLERPPTSATAPPQQTSGGAFPAVGFVDFSVECPFDKFYGINGRPKLGAKLLDRFFHRRRLVSPPVNSLTHRVFDGSQHVLDCNVTVGSRHGAVALNLSSRMGSSVASRCCPARTPRGAWPAASRWHWRWRGGGAPGRAR